MCALSCARISARSDGHRRAGTTPTAPVKPAPHAARVKENEGLSSDTMGLYGHQCDLSRRLAGGVREINALNNG